MKKLLNDDFNFSDLRNMIRRESKRNNNIFVIILAVIGAAAAVAAVVFVITRYFGCCAEYGLDDFNCCEDEDEYCDENGCCYTDEKDFEN